MKRFLYVFIFFHLVLCSHFIVPNFNLGKLYILWKYLQKVVVIVLIRYHFIKRINGTLALRRIDVKHDSLSVDSLLNPFVPNSPFSYPLKASENLQDFRCFQEVEKGSIGNEWVKLDSQKDYQDLEEDRKKQKCQHDDIHRSH